jgi:flagellin
MLSISNPIDYGVRLARVDAALSKTTEKLSSGQRVNRAADDAGGLAISESLRTQVRGNQQAAANIQDAINIVKIGEDGVQTSIDVMQRLRELVVQAANGTNSDESLSAIQTEIDEIKKAVLQVFETAHTFRDALDGVPVDRTLEFQVGANEGEVIKVDYNDLRTTLINFIIPAYGYTELFNDPEAARFAAGQFGGVLPPPNAPVPPPPLFPPFPPGTTFAQAFPKVLIVEPNTPTNIQNSFNLVDTTRTQLTEEVAYLGATHNKLEYTLNNVMTSVENFAAAESRIRDTDMAAETTAMARSQILQQSAQAVIAQGSTKQSAILQLLRGAGGES